MQDLFGNEIELPARHPRVSAQLGIGSAPQPNLPFPSPASPEPIVDVELDENGEPIPLPLRDAVKEYLDDHGLAYVDVSKVKQDYFRDADLRIFDFVVNTPEEHSWLLLVSDTSDVARADLRQWERVFGPGFTGLVAVREFDDDPITFVTLDGERVTLE